MQKFENLNTLQYHRVSQHQHKKFQYHFVVIFLFSFWTLLFNSSTAATVNEKKIILEGSTPFSSKNFKRATAQLVFPDPATAESIIDLASTPLIGDCMNANCSPVLSTSFIDNSSSIINLT